MANDFLIGLEGDQVVHKADQEHQKRCPHHGERPVGLRHKRQADQGRGQGNGHAAHQGCWLGVPAVGLRLGHHAQPARQGAHQPCQDNTERKRAGYRYKSFGCRHFLYSRNSCSIPGLMNRPFGLGG